MYILTLKPSLLARSYAQLPLKVMCCRFPSRIPESGTELSTQYLEACAKFKFTHPKASRSPPAIDMSFPVYIQFVPSLLTCPES